MSEMSEMSEKSSLKVDENWHLHSIWVRMYVEYCKIMTGGKGLQSMYESNKR